MPDHHRFTRGTRVALAPATWHDNDTVTSGD
jgi:hypothetical protein